MKKVFVSTGFYKKDSPLEVIKNFIYNDIKNIEFSGGKYLNKKNINKIIIANKRNNIRIHNYFPAPKSKFVINLGSENKTIVKKSMAQLRNSILLANKLNNEFFSFHAGFRIDPKPKSLGKKLEKIKLVEKKEA